MHLISLEPWEEFLDEEPNEWANNTAKQHLEAISNADLPTPIITPAFEGGYSFQWQSGCEVVSVEFWNDHIISTLGRIHGDATSSFIETSTVKETISLLKTMLPQT